MKAIPAQSRIDILSPTSAPLILSTGAAADSCF
jgi:hypothetical protein